MNKGNKVSKILAVVAGVCASMPQVYAVPAGVRDKNDVKFGVEKNVNQKMNRPNVKGNNLERRPRSKSMGPLARNVKANNKTVSLAQNTKPQEPNVKSTKSEVNVVKSLGSTRWRDENGQVKTGKIVVVSLGGTLITGIIVGGILLVPKWVNGRFIWEKSEQGPGANDVHDNSEFHVEGLGGNASGLPSGAKIVSTPLCKKVALNGGKKNNNENEEGKEELKIEVEDNEKEEKLDEGEIGEGKKGKIGEEKIGENE